MDMDRRIEEKREKKKECMRKLGKSGYMLGKEEDLKSDKIEELGD
jgi:hypothetical protein